MHSGNINLPQSCGINSSYHNPLAWLSIKAKIFPKNTGSAKFDGVPSMNGYGQKFLSPTLEMSICPKYVTVYMHIVS